MFSYRLIWICLPAVILFLSYVHAGIEDDFHKRFTNQKTVVWVTARTMVPYQKYELEQICVKAHEKAGKGTIKYVEQVSLHQAALKFKKNWVFNPVTIDVVTYWHHSNPYYITQGLCPNCVFYLREAKTEPSNTYRLVSHVCGILVEPHPRYYIHKSRLYKFVRNKERPCALEKTFM